MDMAKISAEAQSFKVGIAWIYYQTKLTFLEISKQKARHKLKYLILYIAIHLESVVNQDF